MHEHSELIERLQKLERQNRWVKRGVLAVTAGLAITLFMGAGGDKPEVLDEIRVKKLIVEDDAGIVRCIVQADAEGITKLELRDRRGQERIRLQINEQNGVTSVTHWQRNGVRRASSGCQSLGSHLSYFNAFGRNGKGGKGVNSAQR